MRKEIAAGLALVFLSSVVSTYASPLRLGFSGRTGLSKNQYRWGETGNGNQVTGQSGQNLSYSETDGTQGAFAQLIWVGGDGAKDPFAYNGTGVSDDDVVVATTYSFGGTSGILGPFTNEFKYSNVGTNIIGAAQNGSNYYVRVYNGANPNFGLGVAAPVTGVTAMTYYYESGTDPFAYGASDPNDVFSFGEGSDRTTSTEMSPVPEPTTMGLLAVGAAVVAMRRRRKS